MKIGKAMLVILGGLPGVGKTSVARALAHRLGAVHVRIDSIEQALRRSGEIAEPIGVAGYVVGYAVAEDNLRLGRIVIADSVNPVAETRDAWLSVARNAAVCALQVELVCSNATEHRRRVETRVADIDGHKMPLWTEVMARDYRPWTGDVLRLDTATLGIEECVDRLVEAGRR